MMKKFFLSGAVLPLLLLGIVLSCSRPSLVEIPLEEGVLRIAMSRKAPSLWKN